MNGKESQINVFDDGMKSDFDPQRINNRSYTYALNGRVIFNEDGTLSWENAKGNKLAVVCGFDYGNSNNYRFISACEIDNRLIVFSTQNTVESQGGFSEIGVITEPQAGTYVYETKFNDKYDPYSQLLKFSTRYQIKSHAILENQDTVRTYWTDDFNEPRVFNVARTSAIVTGKYVDKSFSVHGMDRMCDVQFGLLKYIKNISGNLTTGKREYFYRLYQASGYVTPWSPGSGLIFLSEAQVNPTDATQYEMSASGLPTIKGHQLEIKYIDLRFQKIEVACALYETNTAPLRADIIFQGDITGSSMIISHTQNTGIPVLDFSLLVQRYNDVLQVKTQVINENYYHNGNVVFRKNLEIDTEKVTIIPFVKQMLSDEYGGIKDVPPLVLNSVYNDSVNVKLFAGWEETYQINNDYINYKGTQWEHLYHGYYRGQAYPMAIVLFSKKGQPFFAQHIGDFTPPAQYGNTWTNKRLSGTTTGSTGNIGDYTLTSYNPAGQYYNITNGQSLANIPVMNIQGLSIGGVDLTDVLYDENGELQISGFSIVRADRVPNLVAQGLVLNTSTYEALPTDEKYPSYPLHSPGNSYFNGRNNQGILQGEKPGEISFYYKTLEVPDYMIDPSIITDATKNLQFELVGVVSCSNFGNGGDPVFLGNHQYYTKNYITKMDNLLRSDQSSTVYGVNTITPGGNFGAKYGIDKIWTDIFDAEVQIENAYITNFDVTLSGFKDLVSEVYHAHGHQWSIWIRSNTYRNASLAVQLPPGSTPDINFMSYYLVNIISNYTYELNASFLSSRIYKNIGHFVPVNAETIAVATQEDGSVVFNDMEVWGGDCYVDYFGYSRLLPYYWGCQTNGQYAAHGELDYAVGLVFPVETTYNHQLRKGVTFVEVATRPESTNCKRTRVFNTGIFIDKADAANRRLEDFDVNSVLNAGDMVSAYSVKSPYFVEESNFPLLEMVSNVKFPGETYDSFRYFLVNNIQSADSKLGYITDLESLGMNVYVLQSKGFGRVRFNERTLQSTDTENLTVGSGQGYDGHQYIEFNHGCQHQFSVINNGRSFYWVDAFTGKLCRFGADGFNMISDMYGQHNFFTQKTREYWQIPDVPLRDENENIYDNPCDVGGIAAIYDYNNDSAYWTFTKRKVVQNGETIITGVPKTIEYSEKTNQFKGYFDFYPGMYMNFRQNFLSPNPVANQNVFVHNEGVRGNFYGTYFPSIIKFAVNPKIMEEKIWDNNKLNLNPNSYSLMTSMVGTTENSSQTVVFNSTDNRPVYREGMLVFPTMQIGQSERLRGKFLEMEFTLNNNNDVLARVSGSETFFRKSYR